MMLQRRFQWYILILLIFRSNSFFASLPKNLVNEQSLNGLWQVGENRRYERLVTVPGLATNPRQMNPVPLWYRRDVTLPNGSWTQATLILKGARFCPTVYVNGEPVSRQPGGMTFTRHLLNHPAVRPGEKIRLEIELQSLKDIDLRDASRIPEADHWRSNISSCLWDEVVLHCHGPVRIDRVIPFPNIREDWVEFYLEGPVLTTDLKRFNIQIELNETTGRILAEMSVPVQINSNQFSTRIKLALNGNIQLWRPENPNCYNLKIKAFDENHLLDSLERCFGLREFAVAGTEFRLNHQPVKLRAGTVVWHRWVRDPAARELAFNREWFEKNVVQRLKAHGANCLRFHLGMPPEAFLDLCDRYGLMVQAEWSFFHGMEASEASLIQQWRHWFDLCQQHPSVVLLHPWNETESPRLEIAWAAIDSLLSEYPPLVLAHRDVIHIHKYWWSLFENLGLYYDSAEQFDRPIMVDEFGGNYLDGEFNPGGYPTVKEAFLRFLGRDHTFQQRMEHHTFSNARVAEYWRRLGAAGFSPFTILGSPEDGNHWFVGPLPQGRPKPVWEALTAAWAPLSVSLEMWDRNFEPEEKIKLPLYFFNDTGAKQRLEAQVRLSLKAEFENVFTEKTIRTDLSAYQTKKKWIKFKLPPAEGHWRIQARLKNPPPSVKYLVVSEWDFRTLQLKVPDSLSPVTVGIPSEEKELRAFLRQHGLAVLPLTDPRVQLIVTARSSWKRLNQQPALRRQLKQALDRGCSVVMLDLGPIFLGQGYPKNNELGPLSAVRKVTSPDTVRVELFSGVKLLFYEVAEPESHFHPAAFKNRLWYHLDRSATWLWNGLRGGLIVPATEMEINGLSREAFIQSWLSREADSSRFHDEQYYAFELQGFYAFSNQKNDSRQMAALRQKVKFLEADAVALQHSLNPNAPIRITDLIKGYQQSAQAEATRLLPLVNCGKNLTRTPVVLIEFGPNKGVVILSQLLTAGRLARDFGEKGLYGIRYDPAAAQFVLNLMQVAVSALD